MFSSSSMGGSQLIPKVLEALEDPDLEDLRKLFVSISSSTDAWNKPSANILCKCERSFNIKDRISKVSRGSFKFALAVYCVCLSTHAVIVIPNLVPHTFHRWSKCSRTMWKLTLRRKGELQYFPRICNCIQRVYV